MKVFVFEKDGGGFIAIPYDTVESVEWLEHTDTVCEVNSTRVYALPLSVVAKLRLEAMRNAKDDPIESETDEQERVRNTLPEDTKADDY